MALIEVTKIFILLRNFMVLGQHLNSTETFYL